MDALVVGAGLSGSVIARQLAEGGKKVTVIERRSHIGGNMKDHLDEHGILVQDYGPHSFHTNNKELFEYVQRFESWTPYHLRCGAVLNGKFTPTPFNYSTIDTFFSESQAKTIKNHLEEAFPGKESITVLEALGHSDEVIREYARFLFDEDYAPYTAKQWGMDPMDVDPSVLKRVPLRLSYKDAYFDDEYQVLPEHSYSEFFKNLLNHENIEICLNKDALEHIRIKDDKILFDGEKLQAPLIYTGQLDEFFGCRYGSLPYRSLSFEWKYTKEDIFQPAPIVAYPKEPGYTRISEYKQLPPQKASGSSYAVEYPMAYDAKSGAEAYYPVRTEDSAELYARYLELANRIDNLYLCGRLADFKYYNMDQAILRALDLSKQILQEI